MLEEDYYWGVPTSTIDWCEENYIVSRYIAEFFNTTTNIGFGLLALFGIYNTRKNNFSASFILAHLAVLFVGFGSCVGDTSEEDVLVKYKMQLLDELPMIYAASVMVWHIFEIYPDSQYGIGFPLFLVGYSAFVTYSYLIINNPVYHQVCYGLLIVTAVFRSIYVVRTLPPVFNAYEKPLMTRLLWIAAFCFGGAFIIWNIDNQFCSTLRGWRHVVGLPLGAISELHGWWHIGTALGAYYFVVYTEWIHQLMNNEGQQYKRYELHWVGPVCYLRQARNQIKNQ